MTVKECYDAMGADYEEVLSRLMSDDRIQRFLLKFPNDASYSLLCSSMEERNVTEAFRAAHTIKGVCQNLGLTPLCKSSEILTEKLRNAEEYTEDMEAMLDALKADYAKVISCIGMLNA
jgi:HPt (histidine-containing phosphotransfer) domain-containing protein